MNINILRDFRYYLRHPLFFLRAIYSRITRGFAEADVVEMGEYLLTLIPAMLRELAVGDSYPNSDRFPTHKAWQEYLWQLAQKFEDVQEDNWCVLHPNKYEEEWRKQWHQPDNEIREKFWVRDQKLIQERQLAIAAAYAELASVHDILWL